MIDLLTLLTLTIPAVQFRATDAHQREFNFVADPQTAAIHSHPATGSTSSTIFMCTFCSAKSTAARSTALEAVLLILAITSICL
ncbi:MAG TPA: hypothetical protein VK578_01840 [Edaphobacter sp.]|nr:hypothetical protein [Edaphobacter sp.]